MYMHDILILNQWIENDRLLDQNNKTSLTVQFLIAESLESFANISKSFKTYCIKSLSIF